MKGNSHNNVGYHIVLQQTGACAALAFENAQKLRKFKIQTVPSAWSVMGTIRGSTALLKQQNSVHDACHSALERVWRADLLCGDTLHVLSSNNRESTIYGNRCKPLNVSGWSQNWRSGLHYRLHSCTVNLDASYHFPESEIELNQRSKPSSWQEWFLLSHRDFRPVALQHAQPASCMLIYAWPTHAEDQVASWRPSAPALSVCLSLFSSMCSEKPTGTWRTNLGLYEISILSHEMPKKHWQSNLNFWITTNLFS